MRGQDEGTERLIMGQPAYLIASSTKSIAPSLSQLVQSFIKTMSRSFGNVLIVEIWSGFENGKETYTNGPPPKPVFKIFVRDHDEQSETLETLENELANISIQELHADVHISSGKKPLPPRFPPLVPQELADHLNCNIIGIQVPPMYQNSETNENFPLIHQAMIRDFNKALQRTFFTFVRTKTKYRPAHYEMLGRRAFVKAVWRIDKQLAEISNSFDFLLQVTPVNVDEAWKRFKRNRFEHPPTFRYRPHAVDPALLKRQLWKIGIERVEDPTLQHLFREKRKDLDLQISMLGNMNKPGFVLGSLQLYGSIEDLLVDTSNELLEKISPYSRETKKDRKLNAHEFVELARIEINRYKKEYAGFDAKVRIQADITGLMVSQGNLLVSSSIKIPERRVEALLAHEIGVHSLTFFNGQAQPFKLLSSGLAGYEEMQEGLAVLAEYFSGGLSKSRLRLLAARVIATDSLTSGASFVDTFRLLKDTYNIKQRTAFNIAVRTYRAGGLTKDAVYLRGLLQLLQYLRSAPLDDMFFIGKISIDHLNIIQELRRRKVLQPPHLRPHFLTSPQANLRLTQLAQGLSALQLTN